MPIFGSVSGSRNPSSARAKNKKQNMNTLLKLSANCLFKVKDFAKRFFPKRIFHDVKVKSLASFSSKCLTNPFNFILAPLIRFHVRHGGNFPPRRRFIGDCFRRATHKSRQIHSQRRGSGEGAGLIIVVLSGSMSYVCSHLLPINK